MGRHVLVIGGQGGIGRALIDMLLEDESVETIHATWHRRSPDPLDGVTWSKLDVTDEDSIAALAERLERVDWLINVVGWLHDEDRGPEKHSRQVTREAFLDAMEINALPSLFLAKHFRRYIKHSDAGVLATVSARLGSIGENRIGG